MLDQLRTINWKRDFDRVMYAGDLPDLLLRWHEIVEGQLPDTDRVEEQLDWTIWNTHPPEPATSFVMPYLVWMAQQASTDAARAHYCYYISGTIDGIWAAKLHIGKAHLPTSYVDTMRWRVQTYDAVADHRAFFCELLQSDSDAVRMAALTVLHLLSDEYLDILPHFIPCIETTTDVYVKAFAIWLYALFTNRDWRNKVGSVAQLYAWMTSDEPLVRYVAALGRMHNHPAHPEDRDRMPPIVLDSFMTLRGVDIYHQYPLPQDKQMQQTVRSYLPIGYKRLIPLIKKVSFNQSEPFFLRDLMQRTELTDAERNELQQFL